MEVRLMLPQHIAIFGSFSDSATPPMGTHLDRVTASASSLALARLRFCSTDVMPHASNRLVRFWCFFVFRFGG